MATITASSSTTLDAFTVTATADVGDGCVLDMEIPEFVHGSLIWALVVRNNAVTCSNENWTQIIDGLGDDNLFLDVWVHANNGLQGRSVSFLSIVEQELQGALLASDNIPLAAPLEDSSTAAFTDDASPDSPSVTSDDESNTLLCLWSAADAITFTAPDGFTELDTYTSANVSERTLLVASQTGGDVGAATSSPASSGRAWSLVMNYQEPTVQTATRETIRDRMIALITALTPTVRADVKFRHSQDEGNADFQTQMDANPAGALRRFQVRWDRTTEVPEASSELETQTYATFIITVAYPHDAKAGSQWGRDRDDAIEGDWHAIDKKVGIYSRAQYSGTNTCVPLGATDQVIPGDACDFLVIEARVMFTLDVS